MAEELLGNVLVGQSGGPTAVINSSIEGVVAEALNHDCIEEIYGTLNGVLGILNEDFIDLASESQQTIRALRSTPGAALGTCRYKLKKQEDYERVLEVFKAQNIRYFFYAGGNDSQDTADKISKLAQEQGYELRVIGIPKTIDNDLPVTDHCPGYGSVIKHVATTVRQMACDHEAMGQGDLVSILEVMGRNAGWIAAGASLAKRRDHPHDPPHIILLPEVAFSAEKFIADVQRVLKREKHCFVVVGEGLIDADGNYVAAAEATDAFGHAQLGGAAEFLQGLVEANIPAVKARTAKLGIAQRAAVTNGSKTDADEAFLAGQAAVLAAINGETDKMVTLLRGEADHYTVETGLAPLADIANGVKKLPKEWINEDGISMNYQFVRFATPLIQGETAVPHENGLPVFAKLDKVRVQRQLESYEL
ncbi:6-phosphofructokinase [Synoicihabitans lomoniglobus]|uniref:Pyrophosphate--fructose 6-phosphate 1-phosphotransferase n=1 Tax=Synoicihabitans lomoniglobus TaxID=2909285 RepID=A0AAE9ZXF2_9BACT|nr:6-phosphofructokinase [Opitutaceae bacterium LMO-M01]WED64874.1 6-phosphofructokinase [Opitutaceae bacterium LMO-M01]